MFERNITYNELHVVFSTNHKEKVVIVVTVYTPEKGKWTDDYRRRITWSALFGGMV